MIPENQIIRDSSGRMAVSSTFSLENDFLYKMAIGDGSEEDLGGSVADRSLDPIMQQDEEFSPLQEGEDIKQSLDTPDNEIAETIDWNNFSIDRSQNFASKLQDKEQQGLAQEDADKNSYFIKYVDPENGKIFGIMGPMFGKDREQGVGQSWVGGYETEEKAQEDLHKMKLTWDRFPEDRKYMLVELSQLSPDLAAYEKSKQKELPEKVEQQEKKADEADKEDTGLEQEEKIPEDVDKLEQEADQIATESTVSDEGVSRKKPQPSVPAPLGKVPAYLMNIRFKRESRLQRLKEIKG